tara:strand:- start:262 stop:471 length:210 start_codon:yes stop_codon:yes gene_type:complete
MKITFTNRDEILNLLLAMNTRLLNYETQIENLKEIGGIQNLNHAIKLENKSNFNSEIRSKLETVLYMQD